MNKYFLLFYFPKPRSQVRFLIYWNWPIKKMGSPCLFTRQRAIKMGYFYWLRVKNSNHLQTELRGCPCKNRPLDFRPKTESLQIFCVRKLAHMINKNSNNFKISGDDLLGRSKTVKTVLFRVKFMR